MRRLLLIPFALPLVAATAGGPLTVVVTGVGSATGQVHVEACPEASFLKPGCAYGTTVPAKAGTVTVTLENVPPGTYGAQAYWDKNGNGKADRNFFGLPTELVGFSNDAPVHMAPPKFADAAFHHGTAAQTISFRVRKLP